MTKERVIEIIKNFEELATQYAKQGEIDTVANINASIADVVSRYADLLNS